MSIAKKIVALAVIGRDAELFDGFAVFFRGVTLVREPVVLRIFLSKTIHVVIKIGLGENRGSSGSQLFTIALNDGGMRDILVFLEAVAIDNNRLWAHLQLVEGPMHRKNRGIEDVDLVDLLRRDDANSPNHRIALDDLAQLIALLLGELFGVVQEFVLIAFWEDNRSRIDAASQTPTPSLIATCLYLSFVIMTCQHIRTFVKHDGYLSQGHPPLPLYYKGQTRL